MNVCNDTCQENHKLHSCQYFLKLSVPERMKYARTKQVCFNCLQAGHGVGACTSKFTCRDCKMKHHTLLHKDKATPTKFISRKATHSNMTTSLPSQRDDDTLVNTHCKALHDVLQRNTAVKVPIISNVLLSTALVTLVDGNGNALAVHQHHIGTAGSG